MNHSIKVGPMQGGIYIYLVYIYNAAKELLPAPYREAAPFRLRIHGQS